MSVDPIAIIAAAINPGGPDTGFKSRIDSVDSHSRIADSDRALLKGAFREP